MSPAERGAYLEAPPEGAPDIDQAHAVCRQSLHQKGTYLWLGAMYMHCPLCSTCSSGSIIMAAEQPIPCKSYAEEQQDAVDAGSCTIR